ncbi:MAG: hypothetical protein HGA56_00705 [Chlorobiaceae bacterium]|nr:hypothetical protein [Chlorobiaceae bacterium]
MEVWMSSAIDKNLERFKGVLIFSGLFNLVLAAPLMVPGLFKQYLELFWALNSALRLGGHGPVVPADGVYALLVNTAGIDLVLIGCFVLYAAGDPAGRRFIPLANAVGRTLFAGIITYYVIVHDIPRIVLLIGGIDLFISVLFVRHLVLLTSLPKADKR